MSSTIIDLNGAWQFRNAKAGGKFLPATVPGCVHTDLLANKKIPDPFWGSNELELEWIEKTDWEYQRSFTVPADVPDHDYIELEADGLDTVATIFLNNQQVASTENMFIGMRFDAKPFLKPGKNTIRILFSNPSDAIAGRRQPSDFWEWNDPRGGAALLRKMQCSFGWDWGPRFATSGIYKAIRIHAYDHERIEGVLVEQVHEKGRVTLKCLPSLSHGEGEGMEWRCTLTYNGKIVDRADRLTITVPKPELWWPNGLGEHPLYDLTVDLLDGGEIVDSWRHRIGLRTIRLDTHADQWGESFQFLVNGMPVFAKGANWIPAHSFVSSLKRTDYESLLGDAAAAHMNMIRVWGGGIYETCDFYDLCDEKGLLVWQDFMFACALYPGNPAFLGSVRDEAEYQVKRLRNHACLALWCGNNEIEDMVAEIVKTQIGRAHV
jgi:beta-mannosidase